MTLGFFHTFTHPNTEVVQVLQCSFNCSSFDNLKYIYFFIWKKNVCLSFEGLDSSPVLSRSDRKITYHFQAKTTAGFGKTKSFRVDKTYFVPQNIMLLRTVM